MSTVDNSATPCLVFNWTHNDWYDQLKDNSVFTLKAHQNSNARPKNYCASGTKRYGYLMYTMTQH